MFLCSWNEWLKLPVKYPDLPRNAQVALTIWDVYGPGKAVPVGGTTVSLFGKYGYTAFSSMVQNWSSLVNSKIAVAMRFFFRFFKTRLTVSCVKNCIRRYVLLCLPDSTWYSVQRGRGVMVKVKEVYSCITPRFFFFSPWMCELGF